MTASISEIFAPGLFVLMSLYSRFALNFKLSQDSAIATRYYVRAITWWGGDWVGDVDPANTISLKDAYVDVPAGWTGQKALVDLDCMMMLGNLPSTWIEKTDVHVGIWARDTTTNDTQYWKISRVTDTFTVMNVREGEVLIDNISSLASFPENTTQNINIGMRSNDGVCPEPLSVGVQYISGPSPASFSVRGYTFTATPGDNIIYNFWIPSFDNGETRNEIMSVTTPPKPLLGASMTMKFYSGKYRDGRYFGDDEDGPLSIAITSNPVTEEIFTVSAASVNPNYISNTGSTTAYATVSCNKVASKNVNIIFTVKQPGGSVLKTSPVISCPIKGYNSKQISWYTGTIMGAAGTWSICADIVT